MIFRNNIGAWVEGHANPKEYHRPFRGRKARLRQRRPATEKIRKIGRVCALVSPYHNEATFFGKAYRRELDYNALGYQYDIEARNRLPWRQRRLPGEKAGMVHMAPGEGWRAGREILSVTNATSIYHASWLAIFTR